LSPLSNQGGHDPTTARREVPCVTSAVMSIGGAQLYERWRRALRGRPSGADLNPLQAAVVKSDGGERCRKAGTRSRQARL